MFKDVLPTDKNYKKLYGSKTIVKNTVSVNENIAGDSTDPVNIL